MLVGSVRVACSVQRTLPGPGVDGKAGSDVTASSRSATPVQVSNPRQGDERSSDALMEMCLEKEKLKSFHVGNVNLEHQSTNSKAHDGALSKDRRGNK